MGVEAEDPALEALERAAPYMDSGWTPGKTIRPSRFAILRYLAASTAREEHAQHAAEAMVQAWIDEGRRRWRSGFSANPFTADPVALGAQ